MANKYPRRKHPLVVELTQDVVTDYVTVVREDPLGYVGGFLKKFMKITCGMMLAIWVIIFILLIS